MYFNFSPIKSFPKSFQPLKIQDWNIPNKFLNNIPIYFYLAILSYHI